MKEWEGPEGGSRPLVSTKQDLSGQGQNLGTRSTLQQVGAPKGLSPLAKVARFIK